MRKAHFEVPENCMERFADELTTRRLDNTITGVTRDGDIEIEVVYDRTEAEHIDELEELLEEWIDEEEQQD